MTKHFRILQFYNSCKMQRETWLLYHFKKMHSFRSPIF